METLLPLAGVLAIAVLAFVVVLYVWPGARTAGQGPVEAAPGERFILRTYRGHELRDAVGAYVVDAADLEAQGYESVSQTWGDGQWDSVLFVLAVVLSLFGIGLVVLAYMAVMRPAGTLLVTYRLASA